MKEKGSTLYEFGIPSACHALLGFLLLGLSKGLGEGTFLITLTSAGYVFFGIAIWYFGAMLIFGEEKNQKGPVVLNPGILGLLGWISVLFGIYVLTIPSW